MRLNKPRVEPVSLEEFEQVRESLPYNDRTHGDRVLNITRTWAQHPPLLVAQRSYQDHVGRGEYRAATGKRAGDTPDRLEMPGGVRVRSAHDFRSSCRADG